MSSDRAGGAQYRDLAGHPELGAMPWLARTEVAWARVLLERAQTTDRDRALLLASGALAKARDLGLAGTEGEAQILLDRSRSAHDPRVRRDGVKVPEIRRWGGRGVSVSMAPPSVDAMHERAEAAEHT